MNNVLINNINDLVKEDDILYCLGDFAFGDKKQIPYIRDRINCKTIYLIYGNHDYSIRKYYQYCFSKCYTALDELFLTDPRDNKKHHFHLYHYPLDEWNGIGKGCIHLHGHIHSKEQRGLGKKFDVGVDANDFKPVSLIDIIDWINSRDVYVPDYSHHRTDTPIR